MSARTSKVRGARATTSGAAWAGAAVVLGLAVACARTHEPQPAAAGGEKVASGVRDAGSPGATNASPVLAKKPPPAAGGGALVASGPGGLSVSVADVERAREELPPTMRAALRDERGVKELVQTLVSKQLLTAEAERRGLDARPDVRDKLVKHRERVLIQALLDDEVKRQATVTDAQARAAFEADPKRWLGADGRPTTFEAVADRVRADLAASAQHDVYKTLVEALKRDASVTTDEGVLRTLVTQAGAVASPPRPGAPPAAADTPAPPAR